MTRPRTILAITAVAVGAMLAVSAWAWGQLPDDRLIPIHWGLDGQANGFAPKPVGLLITPLLTLIVGLVFAALPSIEPRGEHLRRSGSAYRAIFVGVAVLLVAVHVAAVLAALGDSLDIGRWVTFAIGALFVVIGNYLPKMRSTFLMGIRTPWTLTSERSWQRTHRLGGWLFVLVGLVALVTAVLDAPSIVRFGTILIGILAVTIGLTIYSFVVWRSDPERRTLG